MTDYNQILTDVLKRIVDRAETVDNWKALDDDFGDPNFKQIVINELTVKNIDGVVVFAILEKLEQDGYATIAHNLTPTLNGILFSKSGGYVGQIKRESEDRKRESTIAFRRNLLSGTIGTILGALIGLMGQCQQKQPDPIKLNFPTIQIVHDTIYKEKIIYLKDTSSAKSTMIKKESVGKK